MVTRRKALLAVGVAVSIAGCTDASGPEEEPENERNNESEPLSESENNETNSDVDSAEPTDTIKITGIEAPKRVEKRSNFDVITTITTDTEVMLTAKVIDKNGESIAEHSTQINEIGEQSVRHTFSLSRRAVLGNALIRVQATSESVTDESSTNITITADWQEEFADAKDRLEQFLSEFAAASSVNEPTILDTTISTDYTNEGRSLLYEAEDLVFDALQDVPDSNKSFRDKVQRLRYEIGVARDMSLLQEQISGIFLDTQGVLDSDTLHPPSND